MTSRLARLHSNAAGRRLDPATGAGIAVGGPGRAGVLGRLRPSWPLVAALLALARALAQPTALLNDPDTYLHVAAGRWMLAHAALPTHDPFSHTFAGAVWVPHEWLAEVILAAVYRAAGWSGLVLLTALSFALSVALLTRFLLRWCEPFSALIAAGLGAATGLGHLLARPHLLALPLLALWSGRLFLARDTGAAPPWRLLPVMALWANLHGGFMFGLALALYLGVEAVLSPGDRAREARRWAIFVALAAAAALATPNGLAGFLQPFRLIAMPALQVSMLEWRGPDFQAFQPVEIWLLGALALGFSTGLRLPPTRLALLLALCHMALAHIRHAELLGLVGPLAVAASLGPPLAARLRAQPPSPLARAAARLAAPAAVPALLLTAAIAAALSLPLLLRPITRAEGPATPAAALAAARRIGLGGPVFNSEGFGGYLIFCGVPTFIDGRIELYGDDFLRRYVEAANGDSGALRALLRQRRVSWTLLSPTEGAVGLLDRLPGWRRVYADDFAVIHQRIAPPSPMMGEGGGERGAICSETR